MEKKSFFDKVIGIIGGNSVGHLSNEEEDQSAATQEEATINPPRRKQSGTILNLPGQKQMRVVVTSPGTFDEVQEIADYLKAKKPVIIRMDSVDSSLSKRIIDFISGSVYAIDGSLTRIGENVFLAAPTSVSIEIPHGLSGDKKEFFT